MKAALPVLLLAAAFMARTLDARAPRADAGIAVEDVLGRFLGGAREAVGDTLFIRADDYYHGGVIEEREESAAEHAREGHIREASKPAADWIERVNDRVRSHEHYHLAGDEKKEMLPFFALATSLDPHNVEAVLTTAYWLEREFKKPEEAERVLAKGAADNPDSWEVPFQLANLYFRKGDKAAAGPRFAEALAKSRGRQVERYYALDMRWFLGQCLEAEGRGAEALPLYREAMGLFRENESPKLKDELAARIAALDLLY